jgi:hypothetical protein
MGSSHSLGPWSVMQAALQGILTLRNRLLLPKVRAFVEFLQQHWMRTPSPL